MAASTKFKLRSGFVAKLPPGDLHPEEKRWFAVRVGPRKEKYVRKLLEGRGVECYLPLRERPYRYASKSGVRELPLLNGYLFVRICSAELKLVEYCQHVFGFVRQGQEYRRVKEAEMDVLRRISSDSSLEWESTDGENQPDYEAGCPVEIRTGSLAGVRGYYLGHKTRTKFIITLGGLSARLTTLEIDPNNLIPLAGHKLDLGEAKEL